MSENESKLLDELKTWKRVVLMRDTPGHGAALSLLERGLVTIPEGDYCTITAQLVESADG